MFKNKLINNKMLMSASTVMTLSVSVTAVACGYEDDSKGIVGVGSNSITPIINYVSNNSLWNITYTNTGSSNGARGMSSANISENFGMMSSTKSPTLNNETDKGVKAKANWEANKVRTVTFAIDAIGIGLNLPSDIEAHLDYAVPTVNINELAKLYSAQSNAEIPTWDDLILEDLSAIKSSTIKPKAIGINGGKNTSGKSEAFVDKLAKSLPSDSSVDSGKFKNHEIPTILIKVSDAESEIYNANNTNENSVMYHSLGFIEENQRAKDNNRSNITLAKVSFDGLATSVIPSVASTQAGDYAWKRPFNIAYPTTNQTSIDFVTNLLSDIYQEKFVELGFVSLSQQQKDLQQVQFKLTTPDLGDAGANSSDDLGYGLVF